MTDREIMQPAPPPECYTEEEKTAYAFGWWKAMEAQRLAQPEHKPMHPTLQKMWEGYFDKCYKREWIGLTDEEIHRTTVVMGFNPEWTTEIGVAHAIVRNLEAKLKERNT